METRIAELRWKEVIGLRDGSRFGYVEDMEVDLESGQVRSLVVPGRRRLFGLLGREEDRYIPGARCAASGRTLFWWSRSPSPGRPGEDAERPLPSPSAAGSAIKTAYCNKRS